MKYVIFDLDGTIALNDHRQHFLKQEPPNWDEFFLASKNDKPNEPVITMMLALATMFQHGRYPDEALIYIFSGRSDIAEDITREWLSRYGVPYDSLKMRKDGDYTPDDQLKKQWLNKLGVENILFCVDDRQKVVDMWRNQGLTVFQVAPGNF